MDIKQVNLVFENVDSLNIDFVNIVSMSISDISLSMIKNGDSVVSYLGCKEFSISLSPEADLKTEYGESGFDRITEQSDITSIELFYKDGTKESITVPFRQSESWGNHNTQQVAKIRDKFLFISIGDIPFDEIFGQWK